MKINFLPFLLLASFVFAQEDSEQPAEPIITDLDRLVESVKKTASSRSAEDNARLQTFILLYIVLYRVDTSVSC